MLRICALAVAGLLVLLLQPLGSVSAQEADEPIDPARLEAATKTVDYVFPSGTYARIMEQSMGTLTDSMLASTGSMPLRDIAAISGMDPAEIEAMGDTTLDQVMEILDPAYEERMQITMKVMSQEMTGLMAQFEPAFQDGLAKAYARRFDVAQLGELNSFFATPTGKAYAAESMIIMTDPEVMKKMQEIMPQVMKEMPMMMSKLTDATADLPARKKPEDLSPEDKERLAELLGVPVEEIGQQEE